VRLIDLTIDVYGIYTYVRLSRAVRRNFKRKDVIRGGDKYEPSRAIVKKQLLLSGEISVRQSYLLSLALYYYEDLQLHNRQMNDSLELLLDPVIRFRKGLGLFIHSKKTWPKPDPLFRRAKFSKPFFHA